MPKVAAVSCTPTRMQPELAIDLAGEGIARVLLCRIFTSASPFYNFEVFCTEETPRLRQAGT